ncbi:hypothetical protein H6P81_008170 [Aristolochia fimbriata]|uniref:EGF-like domain-containing protein n=1 Tax=Aristolochia fimbriata TaxID=158543 RepID=A0AAV7F604_ARIFI|nr:hypothetical protein H6P81_008170 [Aristolochia fimbriata]
MSEKRKMGLGKEKPGRLVRGVKTVFFLVTMLLSLLLFSAPVLLVITDAVLPSALLSAFLSPLSIQTLGAHLRNYDFRVSIVDIPLISIARSVIIICVYCLCDGPRLSHGPYLTITSLCSLLSVAVVSLKACVFGGGEGTLRSHSRFLSGKETWAMEVMFLCSVALAVGHVVVAYRTSCRERRKLLVYKIDLEAVSACKKGFPAYHKPLLLQGTRCKTGSCDEDGACICELPGPSTILDGDRPFLGGKFCDEEQIMCDGTNSFWCENGASCDELVHGENYTCKCLPGYTGIHCEHIGAPCGEMFCFHEAECLVESDQCGCPPDWKGSVDCSLPTVKDPIVNSTAQRRPHKEATDGKKKLVRIITICVVCLGLIAVAVCLTREYLKRKNSVPKFLQLSEMHKQRAIPDDDAADSLVSEPIQNNHL